MSIFIVKIYRLSLMAGMASQDGLDEESSGSDTGEWQTVERKSSRPARGVNDVRSAKWGKQNRPWKGMNSSSAHSPSKNKSSENKIEKYLKEEVRNSKLQNQNKESEYLEENTVTVWGEGNSFLDCDDMMEAVEEICGRGSVMACVPRGNRKYEVTLTEKSLCDLLIPSFKAGEVTVMTNSVIQPYVAVSILNLPVYTRDKEIIEKLEGFNLELVSPVYRTYRTRANGLKIPDGTRFAYAIFPENLKSLPYALKFNVRGTMEHFKVKHDNMIKVCNKCLSDKHLARNCTLNQCFRCSGYGHIAVDCDVIERCEECHEGTNVCECAEYDDTDDTASVYSCETEVEPEQMDNNNHNENEQEAEERKGEQEYIQDEKSENNENNEIENKEVVTVCDPLDLTTKNEIEMETDEVIRKRKAEREMTTMDEAKSIKKIHTNTETKDAAEIRLSVHELRHPKRSMGIRQPNTDILDKDRQSYPNLRQKLKVEPNIGKVKKEKKETDVRKQNSDTRNG